MKDLCVFYLVIVSGWVTVLKRHDSKACITLHTSTFLRHERMKVYPKNMLNLNISSARTGKVVTGDLVSGSPVMFADQTFVSNAWNKPRNFCSSRKQDSCASFPAAVRNAGSGYVFKCCPWNHANLHQSFEHDVVLLKWQISGLFSSKITVTTANGPSNVNTSS